MSDLVYRLRKRAEIRRQIDTRKSVQNNEPDRIADLLEESATEIELLESKVGFLGAYTRQLESALQSSLNMNKALVEREQKEWQYLTDGEIKEIIGSYGDGIGAYTRSLIDKLEAKIEEKNTWTK